MSRLFDGVDDLMTFTGVNWNYGTMLVVAKIATTSDNTWLSFIEGESDSGLHYAFGRRNTTPGNLYLANASTTASGVEATDGDGWCVFAVTKATGTATGNGYKIPIGGATTTAALSTSQANASNLGTNPRVKVGGDDDYCNFYLAAVAIFNGTVLSQAQLEGIEAAATTQSIADLSPTALWDDSDSFATDLIGSADRTALTGTTDSADDPSGWVYGLGGATTSLPPVPRRAHRGLVLR